MAKEIKKENKEHSTLTEYEVFEEGGQLYIKLVYILEDEHRIEKLTIPKVELPIFTKFKPIIGERCETFDCIGQFKIPNMSCKMCFDSGQFWFNVRRSNSYTEDDIFYMIETVKEKSVDMTLEEIEKKLGYKVKIVTKEKNS